MERIFGTHFNQARETFMIVVSMGRESMGEQSRGKLMAN